VAAALTQLHPGASTVFKDAYFFEFLDLPSDHSEADLHRGLLANPTRNREEAERMLRLARAPKNRGDR
jgi:hypothetical protein